ncbi:MAG: PAS domain-containing protein [Xanthomonadales bacterium]|nr:PAS domain-containing protein [Xanthomonadales bacterium]
MSTSPDNAPDIAADRLQTPLMRVSAKGHVDYLNPAAAAWLGLSARRLEGKPLGELDAQPLSLPQLMRQALDGGRPVHARRLQIDSIAGRRFADAWASPLDGGGLRLEFHPTDEFPGEDPATLLPMALSTALAGLAHELRNPLAGLGGAAQLLAKRIDDEELGRYVDVIRDEVQRLGSLLDRLLDPEQPRRREAVNVHEVLERVRTLADAEAGWALKLERDYDPSLPDLRGDPDRLTQALINLVRNALEAGAGTVRLRTRAEHGVAIGDRTHRLAIRVEIEDDGRGVPEDLAERIFLPLLSTRADGSGLGLSQAQQVAREHGGSLGYRSRPGHTVFSLLLPVPVDDMTEEEGAQGDSDVE